MSQGRTLAHWLAKGDDGQDKDRDGITYQTTFTPPVEVARAARAGLEAREQGAKGGTLTGIARAHQLAAREPVSLDTIRRIVSFHGRHDAQADGPRREQARKLWGGAAGKAWANSIWNKHKDSVIKGGDMIKSMGNLRGLVSLGLGEDFMGLPVMGEDAEVPEWLGELLEELQDQDGDLVKGAGHKYIRRVPKAGGGWRYFYTVTGGHGLGHHAEMVRGSAFKVKDAGKEGHFHVEEDHGDEVTLRHDETGKTSRVSKKALAAMLHAEHAEAVGKVRARVTANLEQAKKTGSAKQQERAAALVSKYGGASEQPKPAPKAIQDFQAMDIGIKSRVRGLHGLPPGIADDINAFLVQGGRVVAGNRYVNKAWADSLLKYGILPFKNGEGRSYWKWDGTLERGRYVYVPLMGFAAEDPPKSFIQKRTKWGQEEDARIEAEWQRKQDERKRLGLDNDENDEVWD